MIAKVLYMAGVYAIGTIALVAVLIAWPFLRLALWFEERSETL